MVNDDVNENHSAEATRHNVEEGQAKDIKVATLGHLRDLHQDVFLIFNRDLVT